MGNLDSVTVAVTSQLKVLTTAVFSVLILSRRLSWMHWFGLFVLVCGLVIMESDGEDREEGTKNFYTGLLAMGAACTSSGFASVSLEFLFKRLDLDIWVGNLQLQLFCLPVAVLGVFSDLQDMRDVGPFHGWDGITCVVVLLNALGGFLVSFTMKYADNILKTFAVSMSLVANCFVSSLMFSVDLSLHTILGVLLVISSTWLYSIGGRFLRVEGPSAKADTRGAEYLPVKAVESPRSTSEQDTQVSAGTASRGHAPFVDVEACSVERRPGEAEDSARGLQNVQGVPNAVPDVVGKRV